MASITSEALGENVQASKFSLFKHFLLKQGWQFSPLPPNEMYLS